MFKSKVKGFSLLELVVVLAVMGTLAAVAVPAFNAVTDNSSSGALVASADGLAKSGTGIAQSDYSHPGRGVTIADIDLSGSDDAVLAGGIITVFGQKDQCIEISVSGANSDAVFVVSDVKISSNVTSVNGIVTGGQCDATASSTTPTTDAPTTTTVAPTTTTTVALGTADRTGIISIMQASGHPMELDDPALGYAYGTPASADGHFALASVTAGDSRNTSSGSTLYFRAGGPSPALGNSVFTLTGNSVDTIIIFGEDMHSRGFNVGFNTSTVFFYKCDSAAENAVVEGWWECTSGEAYPITMWGGYGDAINVLSALYNS